MLWPRCRRRPLPLRGPLLNEARRQEEQGHFNDARTNYLPLLSVSLSTQALSEVETRLGRVNIELATTPQPMPEKVDYIVHKGDSIERIAKKSARRRR